MDESIEQKRREILAELLVSEKETLDQLKELVQLSKLLFKIDETGKVILSRNHKFSNPEKIELLLIGKYFAFNLKLIEEPCLDITQISEGLGIKNTTLSAPLGKLVEDRIITKPGSGKYQIVHHEIENTLKLINNKFKKRGNEK